MPEVSVMSRKTNRCTGFTCTAQGNVTRGSLEPSPNQSQNAGSQWHSPDGIYTLVWLEADQCATRNCISRIAFSRASREGLQQAGISWSHEEKIVSESGSHQFPTADILVGPSRKLQCEVGDAPPATNPTGRTASVQYADIGGKHVCRVNKSRSFRSRSLWSYPEKGVVYTMTMCYSSPRARMTYRHGIRNPFLRVTPQICCTAG